MQIKDSNKCLEKSRQKHGNQFGRVGKANSKVPTERNTQEKYRAFSPRISDMFRMPGQHIRKMMGFMAGNREIKRNEWFNLPFSFYPSLPDAHMGICFTNRVLTSLH